MATLHKEYLSFDGKIKLTESRKTSLKGSRKELKRKIRKWFKDNKPNEIQPKFKGQGSFDMNTTVNPIAEYDDDGNKLLDYDLDYGVYFIERDDQNNRRSIDIWHDWIYESVEDHTDQKPKKKTTCIRVIFSDGQFTAKYCSGFSSLMKFSRIKWITSYFSRGTNCN